MRGCLTEKIAGKNRRTLSHEEFASERGEFSPNGSQSGYSASGRASSGQGQASAAVRAREIGYCGIASGVADRGFATPCFQAPPAINADPPRFLDPPPRGFQAPPGHQCGPPLDFWTPPRGFQAPPRPSMRTPPSDFWDPPSQRIQERGRQTGRNLDIRPRVVRSRSSLKECGRSAFPPGGACGEAACVQQPEQTRALAFASFGSLLIASVGRGFFCACRQCRLRPGPTQ